MNPRQPILLSTYRLPTDTTLYLGDEEVTAYLNGHAALWHPAALAVSAALPGIAAPYDHEEPGGETLFAVPDNPPSGLSDGWEERARSAGAVFFSATGDRAQTFANLRAAIGAAHSGDDRIRRLLDLPADRVAPFVGIGFGHIVLGAICEAMSHDNVLSADDLLGDIRSAIDAIDDPDACRTHLQSAADRLLAAREVVYPVSLYVIDLMMLDEERLDAPWPGALDANRPFNVLSCAALLEALGKRAPERLSQLKEKVAAELVEVVGGGYVEREEPLLPIESQLWNLRRGQEVYQELFGKEIKVFGRRRFGLHASTPLLLQSTGFTHALHVSFDESVVPSHHSTVISWPSMDGKQVDAFTRAPQPVDSPQTFFHLAHYLHQTIMQDHSATMSLLHRGLPACSWYHDWLELTKFAPVLGRWATFSTYFSEVSAGDYTSPASPDEFQADYLLERSSTAEDPARVRYANSIPISGFAQQLRGRRQLDAAYTFAAILHALGGKIEEQGERSFADALAEVENQFESNAGGEPAVVLDRATQALGRRLLARGQAGNEGWLILNPCSFIRRIALELPGAKGPIPVGGPVKAAQVDGDKACVVVEVPALGFAWVPKTGAAGPPPSMKIKLADDRAVRNEFFEAEIDPQTGALRGLRDHRTRTNRLAGMLAYGPGSTMRTRTPPQVVSSGPALGEIVAEGDLFDPNTGKRLATFRNRYRAWLGRPMLEIRIELTPVVPPEGYAWNTYYAARFAWKDESAVLMRGTFGSGTTTSHTRIETPDFLDLRTGAQNTVIFPGGLPFHQRHGSRMLDVLLLCQNETERVFDLGIGIDRGHPVQTALGLTSPVGIVEATQGPPHVGASGWLFHLDAPNLLMTSLRAAPDGSDAVIARLLESTGNSGPAGFRCVKNPARAVVQDLRGAVLFDATVVGDEVQIEVGGNDLVQLRVEFS